MVGSIIQGVAAAGENAIAGAGLANDMSQNIKNMRYQSQAQLLNLALQQQAWNREDTAVQRRVADLKAAGLSPVLAAGSAASSMSPIRIEPQRSNFKFGKDNFDLTQAAQAINQSILIDSAIRKNDAETLKAIQQRELDLQAFPDKINRMKAAASNAWQDAATKAIDNQIYRVSGISPRSSSEVGRTTRDLASMLNEVIKGFKRDYFTPAPSDKNQ